MSDRFGVVPSTGDGNFWYDSACYAFYQYVGEDINLLSSNLEEDHQNNLQSFLLRRLKKGAIYVGSGNFSVMEFSLSSSAKSPATCFYISLPCWPGTQVICCLVAPPDAHLELFRTELQYFCVRLVQTVKDLSATDIKGSTFEQQLKTWPHHSIDFLSRIVDAFGMHTAYLLQAAQQAHQCQVVGEWPEQLATDLRAFIAAASVAELLTNSQTAPEASDVPTIRFTPDGCSNDLECSTFCLEWAKLITKDPSSAANIKRVLESFKLRTIKDMNTLRRLLKQAETDHYSLYSACTFLRQSGNSPMLLQHALDDGDSPKDVIDILQKYLSEDPIK